ncbi:DegT/DnrJ/EryC1/StrS family aminotransferase [Anaerovorax sp. IOR16]|uniref:DegT/DnrJ/EryC1/StrS family aminotransferase n=1 Tax=Anaerovorax sp. IOR16 TaxID=2773458 RepID=UPI0019D05B1D|nr:DegT/DnrJ/EryC1/StrS aminotransferase family protein [Anaerovorax sp. IOR16]
MEFRDLKTQYQRLKPEIDWAFTQVAADAHFIMGKKVAELEEKLANFAGTKYCITCANGTDALQLALMAWEIGPNDAVFVPDFTFFSSAEVVSLQKATPIFVDVEEHSFNLDPEKLEAKIQEVIGEGILTPRVIIAVDLFGRPADFDRIRPIAERYGIKILEDAAQGFGGSLHGKRACSFGDISTTSFFPAKPLGCYGDGGAVFTDDIEMAELIKSYRSHGKGKEKYDNVRIGLNSRLDTIQAAILLIKLEAFEKYELEAVERISKQYTNALRDVVKVPQIPEKYASSWAQYTIVLANRAQRDGLQAHLKEFGIPSMIYYPIPMHRQKAFEEIPNCEKDYLVTNSLCDTVLALPFHPYMEMEDIQWVVDHVKSYL